MFTQKRLNASVPGGMRSTTERELPGERNQEVKDENYNNSSDRNVDHIYS